MAVRALRRDGVHGGNARAHASRSRCGGAPLCGAAARRIARLGILFGLTPWALFIVIGGAKLVIASLRTLETFPDTNNPGYFIIKLALWLLAGLILLQGAIDLTRSRRSP